MGRKQKYPITLIEKEREELKQVVKTGRHSARERRRAQTLLWSDAGRSDKEIAELHGVTPLTVATTRQRWAEEKRISDKPKPGREKKLDGKKELRNFAHGLKRDEAAVEAALVEPWSNGQVEGHVNRLKFYKRQMYGRAKFDLLRLRVLSAI